MSHGIRRCHDWGPGNCGKSPGVLLTSSAHSCLRCKHTHTHTRSQTHTVWLHTQGENKATCQRSPFILHVSVKDKKLADSRASQTGQQVTGSEHSLVWKWLRERRTISNNPTMLSMFRGAHWAHQARNNACFC